MDPRERLRKYLEQRREMGERELLLDELSVDDVMKLLGAAGATRAPVERERAKPPVADETVPARRPRDEPVDTGGDWREALRAAGAGQKGGNPAVPKSSTPSGAADAAPSKTSRPRAPADQAPAPKQSIPRGAFPPPAEPQAPSPAAAEPNASGSTTPPHPSGTGGGPAPGSAGIIVGSTDRELFGGPFGQLATLEELAATVAKCTRCPLYATAKNAVPGEGNPDADLVCVGEAPGANEDETGRPFIGQAGQLLTKILGAINLAREDVFICNVLKHRPPGNRNPAPVEVEACSPYLVRQLELIRPKAILALGTFAAQTLLNTKLPIGRLRGAVHRYHGVPLVVTYHPAALLRNPAWKRPTWEDVQLVRRILDRATGAP